MKKTIRYLWIICIIAIGFLYPENVNAGTEKEQEDAIEYAFEYNFETMIACPEKLENTLVYVTGYKSILENGIIIYFSEQDFRYDTKENAIWIPEREDYPLEKFLSEYKTFQYGHDFNIWIPIVFHKQQELPYAGTGTYLLKNFQNDPIFQKSTKNELNVEKRYEVDFKNQGNPTMVSYYRLMGNPWKYDGQQIIVEASFTNSGLVINANLQRDKCLAGMKLIDNVNGVTVMDSEQILLDIILEKYAKEFNADTVQLGTIMIAENMHFSITGVYCMFEEDYDDLGNIKEFLGYKDIGNNILIHEFNLDEHDINKLKEKLEFISS